MAWFGFGGFVDLQPGCGAACAGLEAYIVE
jgi:hypothetical protein